MASQRIINAKEAGKRTMKFYSEGKREAGQKFREDQEDLSAQIQ